MSELFRAVTEFANDSLNECEAIRNKEKKMHYDLLGIQSNYCILVQIHLSLGKLGRHALILK